MHVSNIQIFVSDVVLCFMFKKTGNVLFIFVEFFFYIFFKKRAITVIENLRHSSLDSHVFNTWVKFQIWVALNERDIYIHKI